MIHIDGSHNEGGGQILRTALALSILTGKPFRAAKIRHYRPKPGLKNQHLTCIRALEQITKVHVRGARRGSTLVEFFPVTQKSGPIKIQGLSAASLKLINAKVAERQSQGAVRELHHFCPVEFENEYCKTTSDGTVISLWTVDQNQNIFIGADALGERGKRAEKVGAEAAGKLMRVLNSDAVVDHHLADNLIPLLALLGGRMITSKITGHIHSKIYVCEKFLNVNFKIDEKRNEITAE